MTDPVVVVSTVDDRWLPLVAVVARSIADTCRSNLEVEYHVFHAGTDTETAAAITAFQPGNVHIIVHRSVNPFEHFSTPGILPNITLMRLALPDLLPDHDRVIYLDVDLMVLRDISELAMMDLRGSPMAAVEDILLVILARQDKGVHAAGDFSARRHLEEVIGLNALQFDEYRNTGVFCASLQQLRERDFTRHAVRLLEEGDGDYRFRDQDVINVALRGEILALDPRWNVMPQLYDFRSLADAEAGDLRVLETQLSGPRCIHYAGVDKPWGRSTLIPRAGQWWYFARRTPVLKSIERLYRDSLRKRGSRPNPFRSLAAFAESVQSRRGRMVRPMRHRLLEMGVLSSDVRHS